VTGDLGNPQLAQELGSNAANVLRMNLDGTVPVDNPLAGSFVYSFGHRNSFGFSFEPVTGDLWQTENGPEREDEVNQIFPGRNYRLGPGLGLPWDEYEWIGSRITSPDVHRDHRVNRSGLL
jgi:glucose/arabinose dehydrogenase